MAGTADDQYQLVTADEVAAKLGLRPTTIMEWTRQGRIPCERLTAKVIRFRLQDVLSALEKGGACPISTPRADLKMDGMSATLTIGQAAARFGLPTWKLRRLYERGLLPPAERVGIVRVVAHGDLPRIKAALIDAGYLPGPAR